MVSNPQSAIHNPQLESPQSHVAVIGGGITGLAAAHRLVELDPAVQVTLFEAGPRLGGVLETQREAGYLLELSADNFITNVPWATELCRRVGLAGELLPSCEAQRRAMVVHDGRLERVPEGFALMAAAKVWPLLSTPILSWRGKLRLCCEYFVPRRADAGDESLASFARRRLGREAFERLVQPLVAGIYTADAERLSLAAALPRFLEMERRYGSLCRAARREARIEPSAAEAAGARYGLFVAPREGLSSLVTAVAARLPAGTVELDAPVERIAARDDGGWHVSVAGEPAAREFDAVIVAVPAPQAARILESADAQLAAELRQIPYAGATIAIAGYRREQIAHPLDGFGFVVPDIERRDIIAASFSSVKFPGRAPAGRTLIRVFLGGAARPEMVTLPEADIRAIVERELGELIGARGEPELFRVCRWHASMPQYHVGHVERVGRIESRVAALAGLRLAGNAYHGVGVPQCIHSGEQAAEEIIGKRC